MVCQTLLELAVKVETFVAETKVKIDKFESDYKNNIRLQDAHIQVCREKVDRLEYRDIDQIKRDVERLQSEKTFCKCDQGQRFGEMRERIIDIENDISGLREELINPEPKDEKVESDESS